MDCLLRITPMSENRPSNEEPNATTGRPLEGAQEITGSFVGTTDEIIQWAACKWGLNVDWARGWAAAESFWRMDTLGSYTTNHEWCLPGHELGQDDRPGQCPQSVGIMQIRYRWHRIAFNDYNPAESTAWNLDFAFAFWRNCFDGGFTWLNDLPRGRQYAAGDALGCMAVWHTNRWYSDPAILFMNRLEHEYISARVWEQPAFTPSEPV